MRPKQNLEYELRNQNREMMLNLLSPTYYSSDSVLFNKAFLQWREQIDYHVMHRNSKNKNYEDPEQAELLKAAREHVSTYSKPKDSDILITLTHPLHILLTYPTCLVQEEIVDERNYLNSLDNLLKHFPREKTKVVLFETLHHYAAATSLLLENCLVDTVIFTEYDSGELIEPGKFKLGNVSEIYCGGGYDGLCFRTTLFNIMTEVLDSSKITAIKGLVLNSPALTKRLIADEIEWPVSFVKGQTITLSNLYERLVNQ